MTDECLAHDRERRLGDRNTLANDSAHAIRDRERFEVDRERSEVDRERSDYDRNNCGAKVDR
jgi:hypothetical protein